MTKRRAATSRVEPKPKRGKEPRPLRVRIELRRAELFATARYCFDRAGQLARWQSAAIGAATNEERLAELSELRMLVERGAFLARTAEGLDG